MRVLIADDSDFLVKRLAATLGQISGIEVAGRAGTVAEASEAVRNLKPDVVILDIGMPGGSGIDVLEGMKKDRLNAVVIVLTNYGLPEYRKRCMESGARFFFDKSTEFERVSEVLRRLVLNKLPSDGFRDDGAGPKEELPEHPSATPLGPKAPSPKVRANLSQRPRLLPSGSDRGESVFYACSCCLQRFSLADDQPPKQAVKELYQYFREHVEQEHPEPAAGPITATAA